MTDTVRDHDGMQVLVVTDMDRRYDEDGNLKSAKKLAEPLELVHASEIAKYYGIPLRSVGRGDNEVPGVWAMLYANEFGQRVPYNNEKTKPGEHNVRVWRVIKDANGQPLDTEERIVRDTQHRESTGKLVGGPIIQELDDGMYVKLSDMIEYATTQGWTKGGGRPGTGATKADSKSHDDKLDKLVAAIEGLVKISTQQVLAPAKK